MHHPSHRALGAPLLVALLLAAVVQPATVKAATPAGSVISNAATATYSDGTSTYTTQSNTVTITVQNVTTATIAATSTGTNVAPNQTLDDKYLVTNTGNGVGTFAFAPTLATTASAPPTITTIKFTPSLGSPTMCTGTPSAITSCVNAYNAANTVQPGGSIAVDVISTDGSFVQPPAGPAVTVTSTLAAPMAYASANNGGNTATSVTPAAASITNTIQADAIVDVQKTSPALTSASQNIVFTLLAANRGYFQTQPLALAGVIGSGLPASGIVIADPIQASLGLGNRWTALPTIALANGASGTADLYYTTTPIASIKSSPASTTWVKITNGGVANVAALNAISGITEVIGVVSGGTLNGTSAGAGSSGVSNGPPAIVTPTVSTAQVTITLSFTQKLGETVTNLADSIAGNNAQPTTAGTVVAQLVGPNESTPAVPTGALLANDITNTATAPAGSGYSQQTVNAATTAAVLVGPAGAAAATGSFSYSAGIAGQWQNGTATTANDYTAVGILSSLLTVNTSASGPATYSVTTPASPGTIAVHQTLINNSSVSDAYVITTTAFADTPTIGAGAWTITYSATSSCPGSASYTTASVAPGATADFYVCWAPPANATLTGVTAYGGVVAATSSAYGSVSDTTNDALFVGGYVTVQKSISSVTGTPASGVGTCSTTSLLPGCVINYSLVFTNVLPKGGGSNNASPKGAIGFQLQEDGANGVNATAGAKNTWGTYGALSAAPVVTGGPGIPQVTYFTTASPFSTTGAGAAQGALSGGGAAIVPASCNGFRIDYPGGTYPSGLPFGANNSATLTFAVKVN